MYMCLFRIEVKFPITFYSNDWLINQGKNGTCAVSDEENCCPCITGPDPTCKTGINLYNNPPIIIHWSRFYCSDIWKNKNICLFTKMLIPTHLKNV